MTTATKSKAAKTKDATERSRKAALAEIQARIAAAETPPATGPTLAHAATGAEGSPGTPARRAAAAHAPHTAAKGGKKAARAKPAKAKPAPAKEAKPAKAKRVSALDAAAQVLGALPPKERAAGLSAPDLIERMAKAKLWTSPGGKTPAATLYAAMLREIAGRGPASRFARVAPGRFSAAAASQMTTPAKRQAATARGGQQ